MSSPQPQLHQVETRGGACGDLSRPISWPIYVIGREGSAVRKPDVIFP